MNSVSDNQANTPTPNMASNSAHDRTNTEISYLDTQKQGEVFICSDETNGLLECLSVFKGKMISSLGGGYNKLYVIQDTEENEGVVSSLHPPELDEYDAIFSQDTPVQDPFEYLFAFDDKGALRSIRAGKKHLAVLTEAGAVYTWGFGEFGALGLGGATFSRIPKLVKTLSDKVVVQIACGEYHTLALTDKGDVYAWGRGFEGQLGIGSPHGEGIISEGKKNKKLDPPGSNGLTSQRFLKGGYDSDGEEDDPTTKLKKNQPLYNPGHIEPYRIETASTPRYIKSFFRNPMKYIACGAYFSLAISTEGELYGWGENKVSQLGKERPFTVDVPMKIEVKQQKLAGYNFEDSILHMKISLRTDGTEKGNFNPNEKVKFKQCAAGWGHTVALSEEGDIYTWGFNIKGQLGVGDIARDGVSHGNLKSTKKKLMRPPTRLFFDMLSNPLPKFKRVACGYYTSFAIDENGKLYSWGGGPIGHKDDQIQDLPRIVEAYTENRRFTDIFCTMKTSLFFAPIRVISLLPRAGPSSGGTMVSLLGTGFTETGRQRVRFKFGKYQTEVDCQFNAASECLHCITPKFDDFDDTENLWPLEVEVSLTLDGMNYVQAEEKFLVYSSSIGVISMTPKCASVLGGTQLTLDLNIDDQTAAKLKEFTVGFQAKKVDVGSNTLTYSKPPSQTQLDSVDRKDPDTPKVFDTPKATLSRQQQPQRRPTHREATNPLALNVDSEELDKEDWICVRGTYSKGGKVVCKIPYIPQEGERILHFNVDVSLNGQQFTGLPSSFRFYDIKINRLTPNNDVSEGNSTVHIEGQGFIDSDAKKLKFISKFGERLVDLVWVKATKQYTFIVPPITWLFGGDIPTPEQINELRQEPPMLQLTLNGIEWIDVGNFYYYDPEYDRITTAQVPDESKWALEEDEIDPFAACKNDNEVEKKKIELAKIQQQEDDEIAHTFRKPGQYLWLRGKHFVKAQELFVRFIYDNKGYNGRCTYKNRTRIGVQIPEIEDLPPGVHDVQIELSYNGQQYSKVGKGIKYLAVDKNWNESERKKFEDEQAKLLKAPAKKK